MDPMIYESPPGGRADPVLAVLCTAVGIPADLPPIPRVDNWPAPVSGVMYLDHEEPLGPVAESVVKCSANEGRIRTFRHAVEQGMTRYVLVEDGATSGRGDCRHRRAAFAINDDGTRGCVLSNDLKVRQLLSDEAAEAMALWAGGGIPNVD